MRNIAMGHHYRYGNLRWLQQIPAIDRIAVELDSRVRIGTMVVQVPLLHPVALAEELTTLDILTRGQLGVGVGAGYRREEFTALGVDFDQRFAMMDEALQIVCLLWTRDEVTFHSRPLVARHPLRREIVPGRTTEVTLARFESMARDRLLAYAQRELVTRDVDALREQFRHVAEKEAIVGTHGECLSQLRDLAAQVPVDPVIVRAQRPDMSSDEVVAYLDDLGRDIVPGLNEITAIDAHALESRPDGRFSTATGAV